MPAFSLGDVEASFRRLAPHSKSAVVAYVLGGAAMARLRVKASTKDVDIVVRTATEREAFEEALGAIGARRVPEPRGRAARAGARHLWETPDGMGWDLFVDNVFGFRLVPVDYSSAEPWVQEGNLEVRQLSPNLVFVMKAFTPRTRDIGDMADLLSSGAATAPAVSDLVAQRISLTPDQDWLTRFYQGVIEMGRERSIDVRWVDRFEGPASEATDARLIQEWVGKSPQSAAQLAKRLETSREETEALLRRLADKGIIQEHEGKWTIRRTPA